ncbi:HlyD family secretion protein [Hymenobacter sp. 15J16-1T3B]|uniref:HlyD family secretion protein n=1 Tax=Hymenobacter sp. 15J16-1T3B TaxID=2886941 RepID=UPI001D10FEBD|nr:HlyD family efflux transporter periplasmic adaptor subunit [Hymenobacter sp. 15J16-1T3B]MCC3157469.1 HlyD family secretion protein [Hymenobacter sp. 15J16-1T3B]
MPQQQIARPPVTHTHELDVVISRAPSWLIWWGSSIAFLVLLSLFGVAWFVQYPDTVQARMIITSVRAPKQVSARAQGKIVRLTHAANQPVAEGTVLAVIESTADPQQVLGLLRGAKAVEAAGSNAVAATQHLKQLPHSRLGEVQAAYLAFIQADDELNRYSGRGTEARKASVLAASLQLLARRRANLETQLALARQELGLARKEFAAQEQLFKQGVLAPLEFNRLQANQLRGQAPVKNLEMSLLDAQAQVHTVEMALIEVESQRQARVVEQERRLHELGTAIENWQAKYVVTSPAQGTLMVEPLTQFNQPVAVGQHLFTIAPPRPEYIGVVELPQSRIGEVRVGNEAYVHLDAYPYLKYGKTAGTVTELQELSTNNATYRAKIKLYQPGNSTPAMPLHVGMGGTVFVVTKTSRLLEKLFDKAIRQ